VENLSSFDDFRERRFPRAIWSPCGRVVVQIAQLGNS